MRRIAGAISTAAVTAGLVLAGTGTAHADAYGATPFGPIDVAGVPATGVLEQGITGQGLTITSQYAEFESVGNICNWQLDFEYTDPSGAVYHSDPGTLNEGCAAIGTRAGHVPGAALQTGDSCAVLRTASAEVRQCIAIFP